jgi:hypothetical protein
MEIFPPNRYLFSSEAQVQILPVSLFAFAVFGVLFLRAMHDMRRRGERGCFKKKGRALCVEFFWVVAAAAAVVKAS